jgi:hypothetical protein
MSRILFVMLHPGFIRYYEGVLNGLAAAGHDVHVAFEISRDKLGENVLAQRLSASSPRITCGTTPPRKESVRDFLSRSDRSATRSGGSLVPLNALARREQAWESLATTVRLLLDYLRFFEPAFAHAGKLRDRAEKRLPRVYVSTLRSIVPLGPHVRGWLGALLERVEEAIPTNATLAAFVQEHRPDLLLVTPLIELGSQQVDYVKCARRLGIRSALCVASWDNLTSKGLIRVVPDHVVLWNDAQKAEAVTLHDVPGDRVVVTGAQLFDRWFDAQPSRTREAFCRDVGLDPARPFVLYVGSSIFIAPDEVPFAERWIGRLRAADDPAVASAGVLVRPHPANSRQWRTFDAAAWPNVAVWPPVGSDPNAAEFFCDYFDSLYYSAAVVGINTSAQLEAGIVGRPVFTIQSPEFAHSQAGTLHFQHLVDPDAGLVHTASTLDQHVQQLGAALRGNSDAAAANHRFVRAFIRPHGEATPAAAVFVREVGALAQMPAPPARVEPMWVGAARPVAYLCARAAQAIAEDRPLWVYAMRPLLTTAIWVSAVPYWIRTTAHDRIRLGAKRAARRAARAQYESSRRAATAMRRVRKTVSARVRNAGVAVKRVARRAGLVPAGAARKNG